MLPIFFLIAAVTIAIGQILWLHVPIAETLLLWILVIKIGLWGMVAFCAHYFNSDKIAEHIGWPPGNPFQKEVAFTNLAIGVCGVLCYYFRDGFWLATIVFASIFLLGAFSVHVHEQKTSCNKRSGNAGVIFYLDIIVPTTLWGLYLAK